MELSPVNKKRYIHALKIAARINILIDKGYKVFNNYQYDEMQEHKFTLESRKKWDNNDNYYNYIIAGNIIFFDVGDLGIFENDTIKGMNEFIENNYIFIPPTQWKKLNTKTYKLK